MSLEFKNKPLEWNEKGIEPTEEVKNVGFQPGYKPPAAYFNNFMNKTFKSIEELQSIVSDVDTEAKNKDGGNADTVDGYHALDLRNYNNLINNDELAETQYEGLFYIGGSDGITGISLKSGRDIDIQPDNTDFLEIYTRIYNDREGKTYAATDVYSTEYDFWTRKGLKTFSFDGHSHSVSDIEDFPKSLPANGGNADTVDGYHALDLRNYNNLINKPASLPANGGNADTVDGKHASDLLNYNNLTNSPDFNTSTNKTTFDIPQQGLYQVKCADNSSPNGKNGIWSLLVIGDGTGGYMNTGNNYITQLAFYGEGVTYTRDCSMTNNEDDDTVYDWGEWRKINDGGNADTIAGIGIDGIQTKQTGISSYTDWNDIVEPGFHKLMERGTENAPDNSDWFFPIVFAYSQTGISQLAVAYRYDLIYIRHKKTLENETTGWTEWRKINDGGNANTIAGKGINAIQTRDSGYCFYNQNKDWNDLTDTGYYGLMHSTSTALHNPVNGKFFYPMVFKYANDSITQIAVPHLAGHDDSSGLVYIRSKHGSYNGWSEWKPVGENRREKTVSFNALAGNWYRIAKGKPHNGFDNSGACGIMTIMADSEEYYSGAVISAAQNGSSGSFTVLSHSKHNGFFNSYRMVRGNDGYMYIDGYTNLNGGLTSLTFTFSGVGWNICDSITAMGSGFGSVVMEVSAV